jgi:hypothetical protein
VASVRGHRCSEEFEDLFSLRALRDTWRELKKQMRQLEIRDAVDWLDWSLSVDSSLGEIREEILDGTYTSSPPTRYEAPKGKGSFRVMTALAVRDALVYRHLCDKAYELVRERGVKGAFFARRHGSTPVGPSFDPSDDHYHKFYSIWMRYNEYRTTTLLNQPYEVLVVADISNYFDSISHALLFEYLGPLGMPREAIGLLGKLLEALKPPTGHSPNPKIGLATDEIDCSRTLAHIFLFEHDKRVAAEVGERRYVRWMDDQNIGVRNQTDARRVVNLLTRSLSSQRLTINTGKTCFLSPDEVVVHFQLEANKLLNEWEERHKNLYSPKALASARLGFEKLWKKISTDSAAGEGNWDKILKRCYAAAIRVDSGVLESRAMRDLVGEPLLARRIFDYFAKRNRGSKLLNLFSRYCGRRENLYESVEAAFFEACLLLDPGEDLASELIEFTRKFARGQSRFQTNCPLGKSTAILLLYWFDEPAEDLVGLFTERAARSLPKEVARSWLAVVGARDSSLLVKVQSALFGHPADDVLRLARLLEHVSSGRIESLGQYRKQRLRWPLSGKFYDARAWLTLEIGSHASHKSLRRQLLSDAAHFKKLARTASELRILKRVEGRLKQSSR